MSAVFKKIGDIGKANDGNMYIAIEEVVAGGCEGCYMKDFRACHDYFDPMKGIGCGSHPIILHKVVPVEMDEDLRPSKAVGPLGIVSGVMSARVQPDGKVIEMKLYHDTKVMYLNRENIIKMALALNLEPSDLNQKHNVLMEGE